MDPETKKRLEKLKDRCGYWKDFFSSFVQLPSSLQLDTLTLISELTEKVSKNKEIVMNYDRDLATADKYFPGRTDFLESGDFFPFRSLKLPASMVHNDAAQVNFVSCSLVKKLSLESIVCSQFCSFGNNEANCIRENFDENKIYLISCNYLPFSNFAN